MASLDRTPTPLPPKAHLLGWLTAVTGLIAVIAVVVLAVMGQGEAATAVGAVAAAALSVGGVHITVQIRR
ncbi:hypothetical protein [Streptomyces goshikiensis]|uniref:hypothetical protein n=1 Tax=Streptomyces goshikiensis TaxID=1942 RepID=UPI0022F38E0C|nr:hypothetical protein [Streptomyces goshikiensis]WBY25026.1 hypothetical protein PET44_35395 [Streptomyces goshikiensis]